MRESLSWHGSPFAPPDESRVAEPLPTALARAATLWPDRPAVSHGDRRHGFAELATRVAGLAEQLMLTDAPPGPVALLQTIGLDAVAAWFACAMSRRPLLLLEPRQPAARLRQLIEAAAASLILCDASTVGSLPNLPAIPRLVPDGRCLATPLTSGLHVDEPAMIFPTSGSTGTPKLVTYSARTLQMKVQASISLMRVPAAARVVIAGSHGNYGFLHHALVFLLSGGGVCLADVKADGFGAVVDAITQLQARHARFTPSMFRAFAAMSEAGAALRALQAVRFSGESLLRADLNVARDVLDPRCLVQNVYGTTESSLFIWTDGDALDPDAATVPIGHIYPGSSYAMMPLDDGLTRDTGELLIRSTHHALGDFHAGAVDGSRFEAIGRVPGDRVYATGDVVRRLPDGSLVVVGRRDQMVKIRGQRVSLVEVEHHLRSLPGITGAAVIDVAGPTGRSLHGFVTRAEAAVACPNARAWLAERLPDFMVPRQILVVSDIPLLPGGKVDVEALRSHIRDGEGGATPARTDGGLSGRLLEMWTSVLGSGSNQIENDFFTMGGDSLKLMELSVMIEREFSRRPLVEDFLADPTLPGLARLLDIPFPGPAVHVDGRAAAAPALRFRQVWSGPQPARGIVLAMPGWQGSAPVFPFVRTGFFPEYDFWAADATIGRDAMLVEKLYWRTAVDIAARLQEGAMPTPRILCGYSIGGSIAWLVGRLLAGSPQCPEFVVMIDAAPLHRLDTHRTAEVVRATAPTTGALPVALHVHRQSLAHVGMELGRAARWQAEDNVRMAIGVPTVDHADMFRSDVLALVVDGISAALAGKPPATKWSVSAANVDTLGRRTYDLLSIGDARGRPELDALVSEPSVRTGEYNSPGLLYLVLRDCTKAQAVSVLGAMLARHPGSRLLRYARYRLGRDPSLLRPGLGLAPVTEGHLGIEAIERALSTHRERNPGGMKALLGLSAHAFDMVRAAAAAMPFRQA